MKMSIVSANINCLEQGIELLETLDSKAYVSACRQCFGSTIGGHIRHNLDHYSAFLDGYLSGQVDYDARERDELIETQSSSAIKLMKKQIELLSCLAEMDLERELTIITDEGNGVLSSRSSVQRELQFLLSHTIHHYALIVAIASITGCEQFPEGFGVAPSTIKYRSTSHR